ncbi:metal ABC transporter solute-binding protein, Zn/Mn family [Paracoccus pacificus]|uniref:Metal ABC transporter solute-binding protein, Zn/Mn family n=1 Tax=Paracoccus pacificus TaxID=1463598 RepID=A0ABW4R672_9RHOB
MQPNRRSVLFAAALAPLALAPFATPPFATPARATPARPQGAGQRLKVATTFTILADMARNVAGDLAEVVSITKVGAEIHGYEPTPRDMLRASKANLILRNGLGLERWFERFIVKLGDLPSVELTRNIAPISISGGEYDGKPNPHAWMALDSARIYVANIADALAAADPANADAYRQNAAAYIARIAATITPLRDAARQLPENRRWLVTSEGAFSYLVRDFGLKELYLWPINADQQGTPQQVRRVIDAMRANHIPAVFSESTVSDKPARQTAAETGARYGGVLYVDSLSLPDGPVPTYLDLLRVTSETIMKGLTA